ncbi:MAG: hypothetical protein M1816_000165 [Peltula sp. TS41687]|nr:MAG: hypothetical protein M1816_000165 [Peltula sp. TS41687]
MLWSLISTTTIFCVVHVYYLLGTTVSAIPMPMPQPPTIRGWGGDDFLRNECKLCMKICLGAWKIDYEECRVYVCPRRFVRITQPCPKVPYVVGDYRYGPMRLSLGQDEEEGTGVRSGLSGMLESFGHLLNMGAGAGAGFNVPIGGLSGAVPRIPALVAP